MNTKPIKSLGILAGTALLASLPLSGVAQSALYNVDGGDNSNPGPTMSETGVIGSAGDVWNAYNVNEWAYGPHNTVTVADSTGNTSAGVMVDIWNWATSNYNPGGTTANPSSLMSDYITSGGSGDGWPIKVEISNLAANANYQLVVYSAGDTAGQGATISLATDSTFGTILQSASTTGASRDITAGLGVAYQMFSGTTSAGGTVDFQVANISDWHALNGFQLQVTPVPEPSTLALCGGGLVLLGVFRRRSSR